MIGHHYRIVVRSTGGLNCSCEAKDRGRQSSAKETGGQTTKATNSERRDPSHLQIQWNRRTDNQSKEASQTGNEIMGSGILGRLVALMGLVLLQKEHMSHLSVAYMENRARGVWMKCRMEIPRMLSCNRCSWYLSTKSIGS
jgi:hypothetical protein